MALLNTESPRRRELVLALVVLASVVILIFNEASYQRSRDALDDARTHSVQRNRAQTVLGLLVDAETGQRGYLLTGRKEYLRPYENSVQQVKVLLDGLDSFYSGDPQTVDSVHLLKERGLDKLSEMSETLRLYEEGRREQALDLMTTDIGRENMEQARQAAGTLFGIEDQRVAALRAELYKTFFVNRVGVSVMAAIGLMALFFYWRQTTKLGRVQLQHSDAIERERSALEGQVNQRTVELTDLASHLQAAREDERSHLARELHDELGALLTAAKLDAARLKRALAPMTPDAVERLAHLNATIDKGISLKRNIIENLRPSSLSNLGLVPALEILTREYTARADVPVTLDLTPIDLSDSAQITIYRLVQESMTNIAKYAGATHIEVSMNEYQGGACVKVRDNGRGFDPGTSTLASHGLVGMRYRVESEGGRMRIESRPGQGALIEAWVPMVLPSADDMPDSAMSGSARSGSAQGTQAPSA